MRRLHLFFPENDLALAHNLENYTPPVAAARLRHSGECLPLWYGEPGDRFVATGVNARWLDCILAAFGNDIDVFDYRPDAYIPAPWGWSPASRRVFKALGFEAHRLPSDASLARMRELSSRRTSIALRKRLGELLPHARLTPAAVECADIGQVERYLASMPSAVVKLPWSSSGRGITTIEAGANSRLNEIAGMIRRQGYVVCEPRQVRRSDFAFLFDMRGGRAEYAGLSLFRTESTGAYAGNILAPQEEIAARLVGECDADTFRALPEAMAAVLEEIVVTDYEGPLGIDMMTLEGDPRLALCELNLRMTMGHVCLRLYRKYFAPGTTGIFRIYPRVSAPAEIPAPVVADRRLCGGTLQLNPPGSDFVFLAAVDSPQ